MSFLLDTNVISEWTKPRPNRGVIDWLVSADEDRAFLSVITLAELRHGVERMAPGRRRESLDAWVQNDILVRFEGRILGITPAIADAWGRLMARAQAMGRTPSVMDTWIAATALVHELAVVTRNGSDFEPLGVKLVRPWTGQ